MIVARATMMPAIFALFGFLSPLGHDLVEAGETASPVVAPLVVARPVPPPRKQTVIQRAADGLFYVALFVRERRLRFVVDTGASHVVLSHRDATALGLRADRRPGSAIRTVTGRASSAWTRIPKLRVGHLAIDNVDAVMMTAGPPTSLLGQNLLSRLGPVRIEGDQLTLG